MQLTLIIPKLQARAKTSTVMCAAFRRLWSSNSDHERFFFFLSQRQKRRKARWWKVERFASTGRGKRFANLGLYTPASSCRHWTAGFSRRSIWRCRREQNWPRLWGSHKPRWGRVLPYMDIYWTVYHCNWPVLGVKSFKLHFHAWINYDQKSKFYFQKLGLYYDWNAWTIYIMDFETFFFFLHVHIYSAFRALLYLIINILGVFWQRKSSFKFLLLVTDGLSLPYIS